MASLGMQECAEYTTMMVKKGSLILCSSKYTGNSTSCFLVYSMKTLLHANSVVIDLEV